MSWLYSQALVEAFSADTCSGGEPSAPSSGTPTPQAYCAPDRMTAFSRLSRFGMTFAPSTGIHGGDVLTWCREGSRARTSAAFATPKSRDWKGQSQRGIHAPGDALPNMDRGDGKMQRMLGNDPQVMCNNDGTLKSGSLNPDWVELLMGWPLGWTDITQPCKPEFRGWGDGWEEGVPRVTTGTKHRAARLKCIGNGQCPQAMVLAWRSLT